MSGFGAIVLVATSSSGSEQSHWSSSGSGGRLSAITAPPIPPWPAAGSRKCGTWATLKDDHGPLQCWTPRLAPSATNASNKAALADKITGKKETIVNNFHIRLFYEYFPAVE